MIKETFNDNDTERKGFNNLSSGNMNQEPYCFPLALGDYAAIVLFPPLYVFLKEKKNNFSKFTRIIICLILTSFFYFPGVIYALMIFRDEGTSV